MEDIDWRGNCVSRVFFMLSLLYLKTSNIVLDAFKCRKLSPGGLMAEAYLEVAPRHLAAGGSVTTCPSPRRVLKVTCERSCS